MAQKVTITLVDDVDGSEATETVQFGLDGKNYQIDLNDSNAKLLREAVGVFAAKGREGGKKGELSVVTDTPEAIRKWARDNGIPIGDKGRIPRKVMKKFLDRNAA